MRFLVSTIGKFPPPPEAGTALLEALEAWAVRNRESGKFTEVWALAGRPGGGAIVKVESAEELDQILAEFPMAPFSEMTISPILELPTALKHAKAAQAAMMKQLGNG